MTGYLRGKAGGFASAGMILTIFLSLSVLVHDGFVQRWNRAQLDEMSKQLLRRSELAVDYAVITLGEAGIGSADSCGTSSRQHIDDIILRRGAIKEVVVLGADGNIVCSGSGGDHTASFEVHEPIAALNPAISLAAVGREASGLVRVQWRQGDGGVLVASINLDTLMFDIFPSSIRDDATAAVAIGSERTVARYEPVNPLSDREPSSSFLDVSRRYPIVVRLDIRTGALAKWNRETLPVAVLLGGLIGVLAGGLAYRRVTAPPSPESELGQAIQTGRIRPYFQPIFSLDDCRVIGCEMLARWVRSDGSVIPPDRFIPVAERSGQIVQLTLALVRSSLEHLRPVISAHPEFKLAINVNQEHFLQEEFLETLCNLVHEAGVSHRHIVIELTERQTFSDVQRAAEIARRAQDLGFRIALDDTGSGHNGLSQVQELPIDIIKIDKKFVDLVVTDAAAEAIVVMLVRLGGELGLTTVAEGIETDAQRRKLLACGVVQGQGYLVAPALAPEAFIALALGRSIEAPSRSNSETLAA